MKRFTLFTFLYLALRVCLTTNTAWSEATALGYPNLPSGLQTSLFINGGASYIACFLSTFPFWRETTIRIYRRRNSVVILPWLVIGVNIVVMNLGSSESELNDGSYFTSVFEAVRCLSVCRNHCGYMASEFWTLVSKSDDTETNSLFTIRIWKQSSIGTQYTSDQHNEINAEGSTTILQDEDAASYITNQS